MRKRLLFVVVCTPVVLTCVLFAGPLSSGALFLLVPPRRSPVRHDLPEDYEPLHKGGVDLPTGLYTRENEDLVVNGTPALILRRTYLSGYRISKQFGIGATHPGEEYLIGDPERFQWAALIPARGNRVTFNRTSPGTGVFNAMFEHRTRPGEWQGARLGWTGISWALRQADGSLSTFQPCGADVAGLCSIVRSRNADGHTIYYRRDAQGRLLSMEADDRWIAFVYDGTNRIIRSHASTGSDARYDYDARGRLSRVRGPDGRESRYTYTERDELRTITEPGTSIENVWEDGRCVRQINRFEDGSEPLTFEVTYHVKGNAVVQTDMTRSDGIWSRFTWNEARYSTSEAHGRADAEPAVFTYDRDPTTHLVRSLTLTCPDRTGRTVQRSSLVRPDNEEWIKRDLVRTYCSWRGVFRQPE